MANLRRGLSYTRSNRTVPIHANHFDRFDGFHLQIEISNVTVKNSSESASARLA
jgi:hypothetical protein